jgi:hypothetical protein
MYRLDPVIVHLTLRSHAWFWLYISINDMLRFISSEIYPSRVGFGRGRPNVQPGCDSPMSSPCF